jgi:hypothetical protein
MTRSAKVEDINALKAFRVALVKFAEAANVALADADSDGRRVQGWIERDQSAHWQTQIRKRTELLARAEEALRMKQNFKQADGSYPNPFEEQKAVMLAKRRLVEAQEKFENCRKWARKLEKEVQMYKGGVSRLVTAVAGDIPVALAKLDNRAAAVERYVEFKPAGPGGEPGEAASAPGGPTMARAETAGAGAGEALPQSFPTLAPPQVALLHRDLASAASLDANGLPAPDAYQVFDSAEAAQRYATQKVAVLPQVECVLFDHQGRQLLAISAEGVS